MSTEQLISKAGVLRADIGELLGLCRVDAVQPPFQLQTGGGVVDQGGGMLLGLAAQLFGTVGTLAFEHRSEPPALNEDTKAEPAPQHDSQGGNPQLPLERHHRPRSQRLAQRA